MTIDIDKAQAALDRAAHKAVHGTREERAGRFYDHLPIVIDTMASWLSGEPVWPFAKIIEVWGEEFEDYRIGIMRQANAALDAGVMKFSDRNFNRGVAIFATRDVYISRFGFAIPCAELLDELAAHAPIIEVGAGSGYMTRLMENRGIHVLGSDWDWPGPSGYRFQIGKFDRLQRNGVAAKTMARRYSDRTIFCSWPSLRETWFRQMLKAMKIGQRLIVIREGACAEDSAWQYLDDCFVEEKTINIPTFDCMHDYAGVYLKKRQKA